MRRQGSCGRSVLRRATRVAGLLIVASWTAALPCSGDEWLAWLGGGLEAIEGGWEERDGLVLFTLRGGTFVSVPFEEVDLPTSAFITWQLGGRRRAPPLVPIGEESDASGTADGPCVGARLVSIENTETLVVTVGDERETLHPACLDAPEVEHQFPQLGWFGRASLSAVQMAVRPGDELCLTELTPPMRDESGHRIVHVSFSGGKDFTEAVLYDGLGMLRPRRCGRDSHYRSVERRAIDEQRGLWGSMSQRAAFAATNFTPVLSAGRPAIRRPGGG